MSALKRDSVCIYEVIAKSSRMSRDARETNRDSLVARAIVNESWTNSIRT